MNKSASLAAPSLPPAPLSVSHETIYCAIYAMPRSTLRTELVGLLRKSHKTRLPRTRGTARKGGVEQLLKTTIEAAVAMGAVKKSEFERVLVGSTAQSKAIAHPTDSRLLEVAREKIVRLAKRVGIQLKQTHEHEGRTLRRRAGGYAHAKQFKRLRAVLKRQRTILGRLLREVRRKMGSQADETRASSDTWVHRAERIHRQRPKDKNKL